MNKPKMKLCVVTGARSEYGLALPLLKKIRSDSSLQLQLIVTAMHLSPAFGSTYKEIEKDGFVISKKVRIDLSNNSQLGVAKATGKAMTGLAEALQQLKPDWLILLGDRFETFAAATAAHLLKIPIAHLHGGELSAGATDDAFRHSITKMAYLHFASTSEHRKRVIQLGEEPDRAFNVGAIGLDNVRDLKLLSKKQLASDLQISFDKDWLAITFHPATLETDSPESQFSNLLRALNKFREFQLVFTFPNADAGSRPISEMINKFTKDNPGRAKAFVSLGQLKYLSLLKHAKMIIGNSSSGLIEAPSFKIPTINIGSRQEGRMRADTVIDVAPKTSEIEAAIRKALSPSFQRRAKKVKSPYGNGRTAEKIVSLIKKTGKINSTKKSFYDLNG